MREINEDAYCVESAVTSLGQVTMGVVCDGVGGLSCGEVASSAVVTGFSRWFEGRLPCLIPRMSRAGESWLDLLEEEWRGLLLELNAAVRGYGLARGVGMGTTFTGLLVCRGRFLTCQVGDSRIYLLRRDDVRQVTRDQTVRERSLERGTREPDGDGTNGNALLQSVGTNREVRPEFTQGTCTVGDLFVICSDGAYRKAGAEGIQAVFATANRGDEESLLGACGSLVAADVEGGETDNLTVACVAVGVGDAARGEDVATCAREREEGEG